MRFDLSDEEWTLLEPLMPKSRKSARADDRKIMNAIFWVMPKYVAKTAKLLRAK